jgi:hypothetical protein
MKFGIEYKVGEHGWASVKLTDGTVSYESAVSYLHDSLGELAQMAIDLKNGLNEAKAIFMDEPGELQFLVTANEDIACYEARWYKDWASWDIGPKSEYEVVLKGQCSPIRIIQQVSANLWNIHQNIGPEKYKELWGEHEFPLKQFKVLSNA